MIRACCTESAPVYGQTLVDAGTCFCAVDPGILLNVNPGPKQGRKQGLEGNKRGVVVPQGRTGGTFNRVHQEWCVKAITLFRLSVRLSVRASKIAQAPFVCIGYGKFNLSNGACH